jgi:hypothetical protein
VQSATGFFGACFRNVDDPFAAEAVTNASARATVVQGIGSISIVRPKVFDCGSQNVRFGSKKDIPIDEQHVR